MTGLENNSISRHSREYWQVLLPCCHTLHDPPQLARLSVRGLPNLNEQNIVPGIGAAFENKVRPIVRLHIDGKKLRGRMGNDDEIATDFDLKFSVCHCCQAVFCKASFNDECLGGFRRFGSLGDFLVAATCLGFVGPVPQQSRSSQVRRTRRI